MDAVADGDRAGALLQVALATSRCRSASPCVSSRSKVRRVCHGSRCRRARAVGSARPWPGRPPSTSAPPAGTPRRAGTGSARAAASGTRSSRSARRRRRRAAPRGAGGRAAGRPVALRRRRTTPRRRGCSTGIGELDRVLGGGLVPGLARAARRLAGHRQVDADEHGARQPRGRRARARSTSPARSRAAQIRLRAERLRRRRARRCPCSPRPTSTTVLATLEAERPEVCVIDSVQTLHAAELTGAPGLGRPGARGRLADHAGRQGARRSRCCSSAT